MNSFYDPQSHPYDGFPAGLNNIHVNYNNYSYHCIRTVHVNVVKCNCIIECTLELYRQQEESCLCRN